MRDLNGRWRAEKQLPFLETLNFNRAWLSRQKESQVRTELQKPNLWRDWSRGDGSTMVPSQEVRDKSRFGHEDVISDLTSEGVIGTKAKLQWVKKGL